MPERKLAGRLRGYTIRTGKAYVHWFERYLLQTLRLPPLQPAK
jgi:hypothetical protein